RASVCLTSVRNATWLTCSGHIARGTWEGSSRLDLLPYAGHPHLVNGHPRWLGWGPPVGRGLAAADRAQAGPLEPPSGAGPAAAADPPPGCPASHRSLTCPRPPIPVAPPRTSHQGRARAGRATDRVRLKGGAERMTVDPATPDLTAYAWTVLNSSGGK